MKKIVLSILALSCFTLAIDAQELSENAIGLRLGDSNGLGAEVSYQRAIGETNRLEAGLSWRDGKNYDGFKLVGLYQWVWLLDGDFNWYAGAGGGIGSYSYKWENSFVVTSSRETFIFAAGDVGIEYNFDFPLLISLDFRPEIGFGDYDDNNGLGFDIGLGVRYKF